MSPKSWCPLKVCQIHNLQLLQLLTYATVMEFLWPGLTDSLALREILGHEDSLDIVANVTENINDVNEDKMNILPSISQVLIKTFGKQRDV